MDYTKSNQMLATLKGMANANRLKILRAIDSAPQKKLAVNDIAKLTKLSQPKVSDHLKILRSAKIVVAKQIENKMLYSIKDQAVIKIIYLLS